MRVLFKWRDVTSYSQTETDHTPRSWELKTTQMRITVHKHQYYDPDQWLLSAYGTVSIDKHVLGSKDIALAKLDAIKTVSQLIKELQADIDKINLKDMDAK